MIDKFTQPKISITDALDDVEVAQIHFCKLTFIANFSESQLMPVDTARRLSLPRASISLLSNADKTRMAALRAKTKKDEKDAIQVGERIIYSRTPVLRFHWGL